MSETTKLIGTPIGQIERPVTRAEIDHLTAIIEGLEAIVHKLQDWQDFDVATIRRLYHEVDLERAQAAVAEIELEKTKHAMGGRLATAMNLANSDKTAVLLACAAFDKLEAQHAKLLTIAQEVANTYGNNSVAFHRSMSHLRAAVGVK